jgi:flagellar assembly protein FliH
MLLRAHSSGVREGEERERARGQEQLHQERERISQALRDFENSVTEYFSRTEVEVVELALQIASKILQREAQADPKLMAKLVHALLEKLHQNTRVKVRVRPEHLARWRSDLAALNDGQTMIDILEDESVAPGGCVLETELGTTEISLDAQFAEVANGLFDLLARPKSSL